jgi:hypothetical protein
MTGHGGCRLILIHNTARQIQIPGFKFPSVVFNFFQIAHGPSQIRLQIRGQPFTLRLDSKIIPHPCCRLCCRANIVIIVPFICLNRETEVKILTAMYIVLALGLARNFSSTVSENLKLHLVECMLPVDGPNRRSQELGFDLAG